MNKINMTFEEVQNQSWFKPGVRILVGEWYWVGDINELGGVCDDCPAFHYKTVITAYIEAPEEAPVS